MQKVLSGADSPPWTANELATLKPAELYQLRAYSASRYASLTAEQKAHLREWLPLLLVTISTAGYTALADFDPPGIGA
jgi:hypothetical protein